jgi:hypothetical protein
VSALPDDDVADDSIPVSLTTSGGGPTATVTVISVDDDTQAIQTPTSLMVLEGGTLQLGVRLLFRPASDVTVTLAPGSSAVATVSPSTLTFTPADYATTQFVTLSGTQDNDLVANTTTITASAPGIADAVTNVTVNDDDTQAIQAATSLSVNENQTQNLGVRLAFQPATVVNVNVATTFADVSLGAATLVFTPGNYDTVQNVVVTGLLDLDATTEFGTIVLSSVGLPNRNVNTSVVERTARFGSISANQSNLVLTDAVVYAYPVTITAGEAPFGFGANAGAAGGTIQLALYTDAGGGPGSLVAGTSSAISLTGIGAMDQQLAAAGSAVTAGTYWLTVRGATSATLRSGGPANARCVRLTNLDVAQPWPAVFGPSTCASAAPLNIYVFTVH